MPAWWERHLNVGVFIAIVGLLGIVLPILRERIKNKWEKSAWAFVFAALTLLELHSIHFDAKERSNEQIRTDCVQLESFKQIAQQIKVTISGQQQTNQTLAELTPFIKKPSTVPLSPAIRRAETAKIDTALSAIEQAASGNPKRFLKVVQLKISNSIRTLLARSGKASSITDDSRVNATNLAQAGYISADLSNAASQFFSLSTQLINTMGTSEEDFIESGKNGTKLLEAFSAIPMSREVVAASDFPLYADQERKQLLPGVGVLLDTTEPNGIKHFSAFATTRVGYYKKGMDVSWEWAFTPIWGKAYYFDRSSNSVKLAFDNCANFNGRDIRELLIVE